MKQLNRLISKSVARAATVICVATIAATSKADLLNGTIVWDICNEPAHIHSLGGFVDYHKPNKLDVFEYKAPGNWYVGVTELPKAIKPGFSDIFVSGLHLKAPHDDGDASGLLISIFPFKRVKPGDSMEETLSLSRPHGKHFDILQVRLDKWVKDVSRISFRLDHSFTDKPPVELDAPIVPEPASFLVMGVGAIGLWLKRRKSARRL